MRMQQRWLTGKYPELADVVRGGSISHTEARAKLPINSQESTCLIVYLDRSRKQHTVGCSVRRAASLRMLPGAARNLQTGISGSSNSSRHLVMIYEVMSRSEQAPDPQ